MKALLVAEKDPYLGYHSMPTPAGIGRNSLIVQQSSITIEVTNRPVFGTKADLYILPADMYMDLQTGDRPHPAFAYGPVSLMEAAFGAGCMDYLREPWIIPELEARSIRYETLRFKLCGRLLTLAAQKLGEENTIPLPMRHGEFVALRIFLMNPGQCVSRESLEFALWGNLRPQSRSLDVLISSLRNTLETIAPGSAERLKSARGFGYILQTDACG